ncbi:hypothetical protein HPP_4420 [Hydrangea phyllody phytoplasma]|uniref:Uncharacterized protein n=2 Tax=16SrI (Aster yellows group) TaxID=3042590 RepID=A0ABQ5PTA2_9MOLU|nr:hypothetical protein [Hydrangea phyllody phytoplasma]GFZ75484.1 hypothetical protein HPP_4420 [Hydrangea phyllody phytoplasma]GLH61221.1 hypothetical protein RHYP_1660 [Rhus yellows phytoplasma]GLH62000.1 hypothetical protein HP2P_4070 [Hydrangea phyllody phytoplasma]
MQNEKQSKKNMNVGGDKTCKWAFRNAKKYHAARRILKTNTKKPIGEYNNENKNIYN